MAEENAGPAQAPVSLPADVESLFVEELQELFPSTVVYRHQDEIWFNTDWVFDSMVIQVPNSTMKDFTKALRLSVEDAQAKGILPPSALYIRPAKNVTRICFVLFDRDWVCCEEGMIHLF